MYGFYLCMVFVLCLHDVYVCGCPFIWVFYMCAFYVCVMFMSVCLCYVYLAFRYVWFLYMIFKSGGVFIPA